MKSFEDILKDLKKKQHIEARGDFSEDMQSQIAQVFGGMIPPTYEVFLRTIGDGYTKTPLPTFEFNGVAPIEADGKKVPSLIFQTELTHNNEEEYQIPVKTPKHLLEVSNMGDDVTWFFDLSQRRSDGECKVIGYICGLPEDQQPEWVKTDESFDTFEDFFRSKTGLLDRAS